ncbi:L-rhamnose mutarotase [Bradyrhizobium sp. HKCCYLS20291]|uniref:L-rhamnose mutarotase n=1 Tax=Bradyrhizobium sp. HKCCYLS20291 TaxID=3420766 RepID=UPI003EBA5039
MTRERIGFKMQLFAGQEAEYRRRHDAIWPELKALLTETGIRNYSIFLDPETLTLFGYLECEPGHGLADLPGHPVMRRWWDFMKDIMASNPDGSPVSEPLVSVFYMA